MGISILKPNPRNIGLFLSGACLIGVIFTGLAGCSSYVPESISPTATPTNTSRLIKAPELTSLQVNQTALSANGLDLNVQVKVTNNNPFIVNIDNPRMRIQGITGTNYAESTVLGNQIGDMAVNTFNFGTTVPAEAFNEQNLIIKVDFNSQYNGTVLPVSGTTSLNLREILNKLLIKPTVYLQAKFKKISWNGSSPQLEAQVQGSIKNPNPFDLAANSVAIKFLDSQGRTINSGVIEGAIKVAPYSESPFEKSLILPIETLNDHGVLVTADVTAGLLYSMNSLKASIAVNSYTLGDLIKVPQLVIDPKAEWTGGISVQTLKLTINTSLINDNQYDLTAGEMVIKVYKPENTLAGTAVQTGYLSGLQASSTKKMTNVTTNYLNNVRDIAGDALITASIPIGIENVDQQTLVSSSMVYTVMP